jgi:hypothetical protein
MILNRTSIIINNDTTSMISNLADKKELQIKPRHMRNKCHMKLGSAKSVMTNNRKMSTISSLNRHMRRKRTHRTKTSRVMCHVKGGSKIMDPKRLSAWLCELRRVSGGRKDHGWIRRGNMTLQMIHPPGELNDPIRRRVRRITRSTT